MGRPRRRRKGQGRGLREPRFVVRVHPELHAQLLIVLGVIGLLVLLAWSGISGEVVAALGIIVAVAFLILGILRGAPAQYEIVPERPEEYAKSKFHEAERIEAERIRAATSPTSSELQRVLGTPLATELHDLEKGLLEQAARGRLPVKDVALLAQELARNRMELIGGQTTAADGSAAGQSQTNRPKI